MMAEENPHFSDYVKTSGVACRYVEPEAMKRQRILKVLVHGDAAPIETLFDQSTGPSEKRCPSVSPPRKR